MGAEIANAAARRGLPVTLLRGPASLQPDPTLSIAEHRFESAADLACLLADHWPAHDILFMTAAVADFRPTFTPGKLRRGDALSLTLEPVPDLLASLAATDSASKIRIGFALEPRADLEASGRRKLAAKHLAGIVANPLETLDGEEIDGVLFLKDGSRHVPPERPLAKPRFAEWLVEQILDRARTMPR